jgi:hypothetical protein
MPRVVRVACGTWKTSYVHVLSIAFDFGCSQINGSSRCYPIGVKPNLSVIEESSYEMPIIGETSKVE